MASALRKIVIFLSLIAFTVSSIIGLAAGNSVTTIMLRSSIVFVFFASIGFLLSPVFLQLWGENTEETSEYDSYEEEGSGEETSPEDE